MNIINNMSTKIRSGKCLGDARGLFGIKPSACPHVSPHSAPYCVQRGASGRGGGGGFLKGCWASEAPSHA